MRIFKTRAARAITAAVAVGLIATGCASERDSDNGHEAKDLRANRHTGLHDAGSGWWRHSR